jgi:hypothetical protein
MSQSASEIIINYTNMSTEPSYYSGRGNTTTDLNSELLEKIYTGVKTENGDAAAKAFVNLVGQMQTDASATTFLTAFQRLDNAGWIFNKNLVPNNNQEADADAIAEQAQSGDVDNALFGMANMVFGGVVKEVSAGQGFEIIGGFVRKHSDELAEPIKRIPFVQNGIFYG